MRLTLIGFVALFALTTACGGDDDASPTATPGDPPGVIEVSSTYFVEGEEIPPAFGCDGENDSPDVNWTGAPAATQSFVVTMLDPDANDFVHWLVYALPKTATGIPQGATDEEELANGSRQGTNSRGDIGYTGPCPPSGTHTYVFTVYALDAEISFPAGASLESIEDSMEGHILASGQLSARFGR